MSSVQGAKPASNVDPARCWRTSRPTCPPAHRTRPRTNAGPAGVGSMVPCYALPHRTRLPATPTDRQAPGRPSSPQNFPDQPRPAQQAIIIKEKKPWRGPHAQPKPHEALARPTCPTKTYEALVRPTCPTKTPQGLGRAHMPHQNPRKVLAGPACPASACPPDSNYCRSATAEGPHPPELRAGATDQD